MPVRFFHEDVTFSLKHKRSLKLWVSNVISRHQCTTGEVNYIFASDDHVLSINKEYLGHDYYTDIITFDQSDKEGTISADIYISIDRVKENAVNSRSSFDEELKRVMIHGILHLLGYDDHSEDDKKSMREKEEACLSLYSE